MEKKIIRIKPLNSLSMAIGGLTSFASTFYKNKFPKGYFKKMYISDSLNYRNYRNNLFTQRNNPYLAIQPVFELGDTYLEQFSPFEKTNYIMYNNNRLFDTTIFYDEEKGIKIYAIPTRIKVNYNTTVKVQSQMEAFNIFNYLTSEIDPNNHYFMNNIAIEAEVPKTLLTLLCQILKLNYNDVDDKETLEKYLSKYSNNDIYKIINLSTGNPSYVYKYFNNILFNFDGRPTKENNYKNKLIDNCYIKQNFSCEIWTPSTYVMELTKYDFGLEYNPEFESADEIRTMKYNIVTKTDYVPQTYEGKNLLIKGKYVPDVNVEIDELDLSHIINKDMLYILNLLNKNEMDIYPMLDVHVYINGTKLIYGKYNIDFKNLKLYTLDPINNQVYDVFMYFNMEKLSEIQKIIEEEKQEKIKELVNMFT